jgi:hypothetical protein
MSTKSGVLDVPACEAALNGVDEQQQTVAAAANGLGSSSASQSSK